MNALAVVGLVGRVIAVFAALMGVPLAFALSAHDPAEEAFAVAAAITAATGIAISLLTRRARRELQPRDGFLLVTLTWTLLPASRTGCVSALRSLLAGRPRAGKSRRHTRSRAGRPAQRAFRLPRITRDRGFNHWLISSQSDPPRSGGYL